MGHTSYGTLVEKGSINIIVDDVLLYGRTAKQLLAYFITVLDVLKYHRNTLKPRGGNIIGMGSLEGWKW